MKIERTNRTGTVAQVLARRGASALGIGVVAVLALAGCAQSDVGGAQTGGSAQTSSPEESDMTSPSPSASDGEGAEDGKLPEASEMEIAAGNSGRGLPPGLEGSTDSTAGVAWSPEPGLLYVVTNGSSSCPTFAEPEATIGDGAKPAGKSAGVAAADGVLTVTFVPADNGICTMDFVPTTTVVEVPAESDTGKPVPVQLDDRGKVELQPRSADGEPGPVAWLDS
ncbi:hypothetical protein GCM10010413_41250 [Promicromonospora sukumoe]|uniref:Uncharacterized protein n=1 Tax=Promicromonospora sukumoe TaxID=88382 RepID=A0A7W3PGY2_9MICO|nr:hypothetical protein [Promicromonospora sukumoe]MBA8811167.1 hypothetical protein [Promicromonospora sukumoe]